MSVSIPLAESSEYDQIFFESLPSPERHIDRLYCMARLHGLKPAKPTHARVLEIGCSTAANIIPQALLYPEATFVGIDLSTEQIAQARAEVHAMDIPNIELEAVAIAAFDRPPESFDYIVCHGLYSWVPAQVRDQLIERTSHFLSANGIAYISFNTARESSHRGEINQWLFRRLQVDRVAGERVACARKVIEMAREIANKFVSSRSSKIITYLNYLSKSSDSLILHEHLNRAIRGFSVTDFDSSIRRFGLNFFVDARAQRNCTREGIDSQLMGALGTVAAQLSRPEQEDLFDLIKPKSFRGALCTKQGVASNIRSLEIERDDFFVASPLVFVSSETGESGSLFMLGEDLPVEISESRIASFIKGLSRYWPQPIPLMSVALKDLSVKESEQLYKLFWCGALELSSGSFGCTIQDQVFPQTSAFIRRRAIMQKEITTLKHEYFRANSFEREILAALDGSRSLSQLVEHAQQLYESGVLKLKLGVAQHIDKEFLRDAIAQVLGTFREQALLSESLTGLVP